MADSKFVLHPKRKKVDQFCSFLSIIIIVIIIIDIIIWKRTDN